MRTKATDNTIRDVGNGEREKKKRQRKENIKKEKKRFCENDIKISKEEAYMYNETAEEE